MYFLLPHGSPLKPANIINLDHLQHCLITKLLNDSHCAFFTVTQKIFAFRVPGVPLLQRRIPPPAQVHVPAQPQSRQRLQKRRVRRLNDADEARRSKVRIPL